MMAIRYLLLLVLLAGWLVACFPADSQRETQAGDATVMKEDFYAGPLPEDFDMARDQDPLPAEALVKFQAISRGLDPSYNHRWILYSDGRLFLAWHSGNTDGSALPFDTELPTTPTKTLKPSFVRQVEKQLRTAKFLEQPPYQAQRRVENGNTYVVTARIDGKVHEVIYEATCPPLVEFLEKIAFTDKTSDAGGFLTVLLNKIVPGR